MVYRNVYEALLGTINFLINMILIDGKKEAADLRGELRGEVLKLKSEHNKIPGLIFKEKKKITNEDARLIQSNVAKLREKRGEEIIGYKIGCVSKDTQKKMGFNQPACGYLWKSELFKSGTSKKVITL